MTHHLGFWYFGGNFGFVLDFLIFQNYLYCVLKKLGRVCFINICLKSNYFCFENLKNVFAIRIPTFGGLFYN